MPESPFDTVVDMTAHPATGGGAALRIAASRRWRPGSGQLSLHWRVDADMQRLRLPPAAPAHRADGLWRHTCLEAFLQPAGGTGYLEFNFSPSGAWAAYGFSGRRLGMQPLPLPQDPVIDCRADQEGFDLRVALDLRPLLPAAAGRPLAMGLAAVVEDRDGALAYWALRHPAGAPDFHDPVSFTLQLKAFTDSKDPG